MFNGIILAAGLSERFGSPKALAQLNDCHVIEHIQTTLINSACDVITIVLGSDAPLIQPYVFNHKKVSVVYNKDYILGQTSSVRLAASVTPSKAHMLFIPVDCPNIQTETINTLINHFSNHQPDILLPTYNHRRGHPPIFNEHLNPNIQALSIDKGLNSLFHTHPPQNLEISDPGIIESFNTTEEFEQIKKPC